METVKIRPFSAELAPFFLSINKQWIDQYFFMEPFDVEQLENPDRTILAEGGEILFAEWEDEIVGTVALKKMDESQYELIKMGVLPQAQGKNIGFLLGKAALELAKSKGAKKVVLYTNSILAPAVGLYRKMGFRAVPIEPGKYDRCDVKMEVVL
ncbi:GNAT family N-acetyltransferase [Negadavirga shengliensis]|jgi:GNAT superfamily N-acetyltransferase|uniref:GNAT family N-acetyltransferase n=1 Tax=Negadavirga shengliensis TaxID=1389218 RepID=A0ABV9T263_9BACT